MRPVLRPGASLLRRDAGHLQVGLEPGRAVVLHDSERLRRVVGALDGLRDVEAVVDTVTASGLPDPTSTRRTLDVLAAAGVITDAATIRAAPVPEEAAHRLARGERAAAAFARSCEREAATVDVRGRGPLAQSIRRLLAGSGVLGPDDRRDRDAPGTTDVAVLVGQLAGSRHSDDLVAAGTPHLAVAVVDGTAVLGPLVLPGRTGCLRCVDAARAAVDPAWPALVTQLTTAAPTPHGVPPPRSPVLESALAAWSVREVLAHLSGGHAVTYGASLRFDDNLVEQVRHTWALHPGSGCALLS